MFSSARVLLCLAICLAALPAWKARAAREALTGPPRPVFAPADTLEAPAEPRGALSLDQAVRLALNHSPELAAVGWEVRAGDSRAVQAGLWPNPEAGFEAENFGGKGEFHRFDQAENTASLSQTLPLGGRLSRSRQVAALARDAAAWEYEKTRLAVIGGTTRAFVDLLAAQEMLALQEELSATAQKNYDTVRERVLAGRVSPVEETRAGVALAGSRIELNRARLALETARRSLAALWGSAAPRFERAEGDMEQISPPPELARLDSLIEKSPEVMVSRAELAGRHAAVRMEDAVSIPDLTLSAGWRDLREVDRQVFVAQVGVPLPLFDRNQGARREARFLLSAAEERSRAAEVRVRTALAGAVGGLETSYAEVLAVRDSLLPGAKSVFEAVAEGYRAGKFGYLDLLEARRTYAEARAGYIRALAEYRKNVSEVEEITGEPLWAGETGRNRQ
jgi:outer membrane protein, heavy metal efflux system